MNNFVFRDLKEYLGPDKDLERELFKEENDRKGVGWDRFNEPRRQNPGPSAATIDRSTPGLRAF